MKFTRLSCSMKKRILRGSWPNVFFRFCQRRPRAKSLDVFLFSALRDTNIIMCTTKVRGQREQLKTENQALKKELAELKHAQAERTDRDAKMV